jgi:HK97 family phage major capsid protein
MLAELRRKLGELVDKLASPEVIKDAKIYEATEAEIADIDAQIKRAETALKRSAGLARPVRGANAGGAGEEDEPSASSPNLVKIGTMARNLKSAMQLEQRDADFDDAQSIVRRAMNFGFDSSRHFRSFGEQLQAVQQFAVTRGANCDSRLVRAPTGAGEFDPTGGGFLVQTDFQTSVFVLAHAMGDLLTKVNKIPISANSNSLKINAVDETSRATGSRWGGVQTYWVDEGTNSATPTRPKFRKVDFNLHKLMSFFYMTDEILQDAEALTALASQAFSEEIMFMTEDAIFEGSGAGLPLGFMNSPALITVAKKTGQQAGTIVKENIDDMWTRLWSRSRQNAVWLINQDCEAQLNQLNQAVGTGGQMVFLPPGGLSAAPYATLYGRPVIATEYSSALGTPGDIALVDLSQYTLIDKGGVQAATSMHVAFLTDEQVFRITYRVDGKPMWSVPLTRFKGGTSNSPFVTLAQR